MPEMPALKGHQFTAESPLVPQSIKDGPAGRLQAHIEAENARWAIVKNCEHCQEPLVAEELASHRLSHVDDHLRGMARDLASLTPENRLALLKLFDPQSGKLIGAEDEGEVSLG